MSKGLKNGDMIRVVWGCCAAQRRAIGWVGTVTAVLPAPIAGQCDYCGYSTSNSALIEFVTAARKGVRCGPAAWFVKIDPKEEEREREAAALDEALTSELANVVSI